MARYAIHIVARTGRGVIIAGATVQVLEAGTAVAAQVYAAETGGAVIATGIVTADANGVAVFYLDDDTYPLTTTFDVIISKPNFETQRLYDVR